MEEYFVCRHWECRHVFRNVVWIHNLAIGGGHYLCPACDQQYRPWMDELGYYKANNIWVTELG